MFTKSPKTAPAAHKAPPNPYMAAFRSWDDVNGFAIARMRRSDMFAIFFAVLAILGWGGMVYYANQPRLIPYVVQTDKLDQQIAVTRAERLNSIAQDPSVIRAEIRQFVMNLRMVTFDPRFQRNAIENSVKPFVSDNSQAVGAIKTFYASHDPFKLAKDHSTTIDVTGVVPMSPTTYQVDWTETKADAQGDQLGTETWRGFFTVALHQNGDEATILLNPAGIYFTNIEWNQVGSSS